MQRALLGPRIARDCIDLFDAVCSATGRPYCVDSSKSPYRFRSVFDLEPSKTLAVILVRDYRAVVYSKMKRGESLESAALGWRKRMQQIDALTSDIGVESRHILRYESLCQEPREELARLSRFLGLDFVEMMLRRPAGSTHHIGGSPSKFDASRGEISLDRSYERHFTTEDLEKLRALVGKVATRWGY
jgi:hypothetical protein